jgi:hypothetical protein
MQLPGSVANMQNKSTSGIDGFGRDIRTTADVMCYFDEHQQLVLQAECSSSQWVAADRQALVEVNR